MRGYYVDEGSGEVCCTDTPPEGCHFEFHQQATYVSVWIVAEDGEVLQENVLWPSLEALAAAGVDVTIQ